MATTSAPAEDAIENERPSPRQGSGRLGLSVLALGVVFGDIGTSPLYAMQTVFSSDHGMVKTTPGDVYGVVSLVFWSITLIVTLKYVVFVLRADNDGEGGVMALAHLAHRTVRAGGRRFKLAMLLGVLGASLFYGDSVITPAISVMSAVEGLEVPAPSLQHLVLPIGAVILTGLFAVQRFGTHVVGRLFGPIMVVWFLVLGIMGLDHVLPHPAVLKGLLPSYAILFFVDHPGIAFIAMGAIVLSITGAEALYADMGHFGRSPVRRSWFCLVFPCLTLNYLGQGSLILRDPSTVSNPFFKMAPSTMALPLVVLATVATIIASQAVISGAFSVSSQAERLGYLPRLTVRHTSQHEGGQIYVASVNYLLYAGVLVLLLIFRTSSRLATAYGLAVTGTLILTTTLFLVYAESAWHWSRWKLVVTGVVFGGLELTYFSANLTKVLTGGWLPLLIAGGVCTVMLTWHRGQTLVTERRSHIEGPILSFLTNCAENPPHRVPGTAVFLHPNHETTPLALRENVSFNNVLHEKVLIVAMRSANVPHVPPTERIKVEDVGSPDDGIIHLTITYGFQDDQNLPRALRRAQLQGVDVDPDEVYYFLSRITVHRSSKPGMGKLRKRLFVALAHNAATPIDYFSLPEDRTVAMGSQVPL
ncbi:potassium transporter Kup [Leekyejoonella antrihumi]|uniref:Probable potassium transport system protein Kup n=1 Tax=Leekyejoonella antrihumi TaxID=1660198 RepID=A0A563DUJ2_9MICO|nr:potassium transporter Kup [Leekyejoonella antrihumi]TWP33354.1 potassium transporter Kup [Leekyejoonella antrihumi]